MKKYKVTLEKEERDELEAITRRGSHRSQKVINALILLNCDDGEFQGGRMKNEDVAAVLKISVRKIDRVKRRFVEEGLEIVLNGRKGARVYSREKPMGILKRIWWRSVAASLRKVMRDGL